MANEQFEKEHKQAEMMPSILAQLAPYLNTPNAGVQQSQEVDQNEEFNAFASHRRAVSNETLQILPQLTSPLSPPAFNPNEILLGSNEAIAGLESPAPVKTPRNDAFNWLDSKMMDLRIGKKSMNSLVKEKNQNQQQVSRNATVFQFPETHSQQLRKNPTEPLYATVSKPAKMEEKPDPPSNSNHLPGCNIRKNQNNYGAIMKNQVSGNPALPIQNENIYAKVNPIQQVQPAKHENTYGAIMKNQVSGNTPMMMKNQQKQQNPPTYGQVSGATVQGHFPHNFPTPPTYTKPPPAPPNNPTSSSTAWPIMTQSYPGPGILQPQKAAAPTLIPIDQEKNMDKEFLAELEKNLGLAEATNNLMPPSPMPVEVQQVQQVQHKSPVPLLPPPQSSGRQRRDKVLRRENSLPRANKPLMQVQEVQQQVQQVQTGPLRVALPEEQPAKKLAHVKPFSSPSKSGMGDVASAKGTWKRLIPNDQPVGGANQDLLAVQRKQLAEVERRHKSQSVVPPSGTDRPTNHLEVNKMAQVSYTHYTLFEKSNFCPKIQF